jgi:hypothetical protein
MKEEGNEKSGFQEKEPMLYVYCNSIYDDVRNPGSRVKFGVRKDEASR